MSTTIVPRRRRDPKGGALTAITWIIAIGFFFPVAHYWTGWIAIGAIAVQAALVLLGYSPREVRRFQTDAGLKSDGVAGPQTRAALHRALSRAMPVTFAGQAVPSTPRPALPGWLAWLNRLFGGK